MLPEGLALGIPADLLCLPVLATESYTLPLPSGNQEPVVCVYEFFFFLLVLSTFVYLFFFFVQVT